MCPYARRLRQRASVGEPSPAHPPPRAGRGGAARAPRAGPACRATHVVDHRTAAARPRTAYAPLRAGRPYTFTLSGSRCLSVSPRSRRPLCRPLASALKIGPPRYPDRPPPRHPPTVSPLCLLLAIPAGPPGRSSGASRQRPRAPDSRQQASPARPRHRWRARVAAPRSRPVQGPPPFPGGRGTGWHAWRVRPRPATIPNSVRLAREPPSRGAHVHALGTEPGSVRSMAATASSSTT